MRRIVRSVCVVAVVATVMGVAAPPASARGRCADYSYQEDAQADLPNFPSLDGNDKDSRACESLPSRGSRDVAVPAPQPISAGACTPDPTGSVTRLYLAYFLRTPDAGGLAFWVDRCNRRVSNLVDVSDAFAGSEEFKLRYGALDNAAFGTLVYRNVLDRAPDAGGLQASVDFLGRGARRGEVMLGFSESPEFKAKSGVG